MEQREKDKIDAFFNTCAIILVCGAELFSIGYFLEATIPILFQHQPTMDSFFKLGAAICLQCMLINIRLYNAKKKSD